MAKANPVLLEPISQVEVTVPSDKQGDVMGDLNTRRGRVQGSEALGDGEHIIIALVPTSEATRYAIDLRSITGGRGRFTAAARTLRHHASATRRQGETVHQRNGPLS